jgi:hypothetical protein
MSLNELMTILTKGGKEVFALATNRKNPEAVFLVVCDPSMNEL